MNSQLQPSSASTQKPDGHHDVAREADHVADAMTIPEARAVLDLDRRIPGLVRRSSVAIAQMTLDERHAA